MLEVGSWDEYLGDFNILVMSDTARHALATPQVRAPLRRRWTRCSRCPSTSLNATGVAASVVCSRKFSCAEIRRVAMEFPLKVLLAYLLGSMVGSLVVGRLRGGVDIRKLGSGNAGSTNALRTQGAGLRASGSSSSTSPRAGSRRPLLPGLAIPRHRAGAATAGGVAAGRCARSPPSSATCFRCGTAFAAARAWPRWWARTPASSSLLLVPLLASWLAVVMVSGFVGLASITAALAIPVYLLLRDGARAARRCWGLRWPAPCSCIYTHRGNVRRMRAGTEPRARRLWLFGRGRT